LYKDFYKKLNRGFSEQEFEKALSDFMGEDMSSFFKDYVNGTKVPDFASIFSPVGLKIDYTGSKKPNFGTSLSTSDGKTIIKGIRAGSAAEDAGLSVNDEIIGIDGYRVNQSDVEGILASLSDGDQLDLLIAREDQLLEIKAIMTSYERPSYRFSIEKKSDLFNYWMR
jgi:predicted metalloprotease with PDZ domain